MGCAMSDWFAQNQFSLNSTTEPYLSKFHFPRTASNLSIHFSGIKSRISMMKSKSQH